MAGGWWHEAGIFLSGVMAGAVLMGFVALWVIDRQRKRNEDQGDDEGGTW